MFATPGPASVIGSVNDQAGRGASGLRQPAAAPAHFTAREASAQPLYSVCSGNGDSVDDKSSGSNTQSSVYLSDTERVMHRRPPEPEPEPEPEPKSAQVVRQQHELGAVPSYPATARRQPLEPSRPPSSMYTESVSPVPDFQESAKQPQQEPMRQSEPTECFSTNPGASEKPTNSSAACMPASEIESLMMPPPELVCPITGDLFEEPHVTEDGHTYERSAIHEWFDAKKLANRPVTSPNTNLELKSSKTLPNRHVATQVIEWKEKTAMLAQECAAEFPGSATELLSQALEYHPDHLELWMLLADSHEKRAEEGWQLETFRCRLNYVQRRDTADDYIALLAWCEANNQLQEFATSALRVAEHRHPELSDVIDKAFERNVDSSVFSPGAPREVNRARMMHEYQKSAQPTDELGQILYHCRLKKSPKTIQYVVRKNQPCILCVSSEGVTVLDATAKLRSPAICRYTFHQILSW